jgi:hypothetical protein
MRRTTGNIFQVPFIRHAQILTRASLESLRKAPTLSIILENLAVLHDDNEVPGWILSSLLVAIGLQQVGERAGQLLGLCHGLPVEAQELPGRGGGAGQAHACVHCSGG